MEEIYKNYSLLNQLDVPRETFFDFETLISLISEKNKDLNILFFSNNKSPSSTKSVHNFTR